VCRTIELTSKGTVRRPKLGHKSYQSMDLSLGYQYFAKGFNLMRPLSLHLNKI
jgi:hypothetical protein